MWPTQHLNTKACAKADPVKNSFRNTSLSPLFRSTDENKGYNSSALWETVIDANLVGRDPGGPVGLGFPWVARSSAGLRRALADSAAIDLPVGLDERTTPAEVKGVTSQEPPRCELRGGRLRD
ncbi:hypothetical protein SKAU_G00166280 [Synaphobranchus kaupii]|uniref:Uncharacterized protein n=1 Tax=Synaphobranchus kaupii TaxID=118154 RepID=A0A9Q1FJN6_SYNKA|nr:hypothetical protein SKAU_G00166280 [Synaphobranchus kaupii]